MSRIHPTVDTCYRNFVAALLVWGSVLSGAVNAQIPEDPPLKINISLSSSPAVALGTVRTSADPGGDQTTYRITSGNEDFLIYLDPFTGVLTQARNLADLSPAIPDERQLTIEVVRRHGVSQEGLSQEFARHALKRGATDQDLIRVERLMRSVQIRLERSSPSGISAANPPSTPLQVTCPEHGRQGAILSALQSHLGNGQPEATWKLISQPVPGAFAVDANGRLIIHDSSLIDYEQQPQHRLEVQVQGGEAGNEISLLTVLVDVVDVNEAPLAELHCEPVQWPVAPGTVVGHFQASDPDSQDAITSTLATQAEGFAFDSDSGAVRWMDIPSQRPVAPLALTIETRDAGGQTTSATAWLVTVPEVVNSEPVPPTTASTDGTILSEYPPGALDVPVWLSGMSLLNNGSLPAVPATRSDPEIPVAAHAPSEPTNSTAPVSENAATVQDPVPTDDNIAAVEVPTGSETNAGTSEPADTALAAGPKSAQSIGESSAGTAASTGIPSLPRAKPVTTQEPTSAAASEWASILASNSTRIALIVVVASLVLALLRMHAVHRERQQARLLTAPVSLGESIKSRQAQEHFEAEQNKLASRQHTLIAARTAGATAIDEAASSQNPSPFGSDEQLRTELSGLFAMSLGILTPDASSDADNGSSVASEGTAVVPRRHADGNNSALEEFSSSTADFNLAGSEPASGQRTKSSMLDESQIGTLRSVANWSARNAVRKHRVKRERSVRMAWSGLAMATALAVPLNGWAPQSAGLYVGMIGAVIATVTWAIYNIGICLIAAAKERAEQNS